MNKLLTKGIISVFLIAGLLATGGFVQAQEEGDEATAEDMLERIQELQEELAELRLRLRTEISNDDNISERTRIRIEQHLNQGDQGIHVRRLQELLATDGDIYPEGLVTGYYGPLTTSAVARLQARMGLRADGEVDDETLRRINQLLEEGAGNSGIIPPGLLRAPGIQRMLHATDTGTTTDDGDDEDDDDDEFWFDDLPISETLKLRLRSMFENKDGDFRYRHRVRIDDDDRGELEIEVEIEDDRARVKIEHRNGTETRYRFEFTDRDDIIDEIESRTDLTEEEIREVIEFEVDDDSEDDDEDDGDDEDDDDDDEEDEDDNDNDEDDDDDDE